MIDEEGAPRTARGCGMARRTAGARRPRRRVRGSGHPRSQRGARAAHVLHPGPAVERACMAPTLSHLSTASCPRTCTSRGRSASCRSASARSTSTACTRTWSSSSRSSSRRFLGRYVAPGGRVLDPFAGVGDDARPVPSSPGVDAVGVDVAALNCLLMRCEDGPATICSQLETDVSGHARTRRPVDRGARAGYAP